VNRNEEGEPWVRFNFRFGDVTQDSEPAQHQEIVERHVSALNDRLLFSTHDLRFAFFSLLRHAAYWSLGLNVHDAFYEEPLEALRDVKFAFEGELTPGPVLAMLPPWPMTTVVCRRQFSHMVCRRR